MTNQAKKTVAGSVRIESIKQWPRVNVKVREEPHFLFIVTPTFSGAGVLVHVLNSSRGSTLLHKRGEGQWLVPGLREDRWNPDKYVDWQSVRSVWLQRVLLVRSLVQNVDVVIEQSPPNMVRMTGLTETFPSHTLLTFNRNPFANCSSILYRRGDVATKDADERLKILEYVAGNWMERSRTIRDWAQRDGVVNTTYEIFCADPRHLIDRLAETIPSLRSAVIDQRAGARESERPKLQNRNARLIGHLSEREIEAIAAIFAADRELLAFFGYDPDRPT